MKNQTMKKLTLMLLVLVMVMSVLPMAAFAADDGTQYSLVNFESLDVPKESGSVELNDTFTLCNGGECQTTDEGGTTKDGKTFTKSLLLNEDLSVDGRGAGGIKFEATGKGTLTVRWHATSPSVMIALYDADGKFVEMTSGGKNNPAFEFAIPEAGTYYVGLYNSTGKQAWIYELELSTAPAAEPETPAPNGITHPLSFAGMDFGKETGEIKLDEYFTMYSSKGGMMVMGGRMIIEEAFTFDGAPMNGVMFKAEGKGTVTVTYSTSSSDVVVALFDANGKAVSTEDMKGEDTCELTIPEAGTYYVGLQEGYGVTLSQIEVIIEPAAAEPETPAGQTYTKVTEDLTDWTGTYLVVCDDKEVMQFLDATQATTGAGVGFTPVDGKIAGDYAAYTIEIVMEDGKYAAKLPNGMYLSAKASGIAGASIQESKEPAEVTASAAGGMKIGTTSVKYSVKNSKFILAGGLGASKDLATCLYKLDVSAAPGTPAEPETTAAHKYSFAGLEEGFKGTVTLGEDKFFTLYSEGTKAAGKGLYMNAAMFKLEKDVVVSAIMFKAESEGVFKFSYYCDGNYGALCIFDANGEMIEEVELVQGQDEDVLQIPGAGTYYIGAAEGDPVTLIDMEVAYATSDTPVDPETPTDPPVNPDTGDMSLLLLAGLMVVSAAAVLTLNKKRAF